eukprot:1156142-Pelagomonas_calceolata.AAC.6
MALEMGGRRSICACFAAHTHTHTHTHTCSLARSHCRDGESGMPGPCAPVRRGPSGLPLRKSQSAVELGSWRSFNSPEEYWDVGLMGEDGQVRASWRPVSHLFWRDGSACAGQWATES